VVDILNDTSNVNQKSLIYVQAKIDYLSFVSRTITIITTTVIVLAIINLSFIPFHFT